MRTTAILKNEAPNRYLKQLVALKPVRQLRAVCVGVLVVLGGASSLPAQTVYSVNIVGCVPDMTINLLTAPLTTAQRQALNAQNFYQLPPSARAVYLHTVAYAVSFAVASGGEFPTSERLAQHLKDILEPSFNGEQGTMALFIASVILPEYSQLLAAHMEVVKTALQELNVKIADQVANNTSFQQATYAGAVCGLKLNWDTRSAALK